MANECIRNHLVIAFLGLFDRTARPDRKAEQEDDDVSGPACLLSRPTELRQGFVAVAVL